MGIVSMNLQRSSVTIMELKRTEVKRETENTNTYI